VDDGYFGAAIDPDTGSPRTPDPEFVAAYEEMYERLSESLRTGIVSAGYRSTQYTLDLLINADPAYQNMAAIYERPPSSIAPVPLNLPVMALGLIMVALAAGRQRRRPPQEVESMH
jgi:MYXO-CTERM domain-containing protein